MPYCPMCRIEYRDGVAKCSDCDVELVAELPPEPRNPLTNEEMVPVFSAKNRIEADIVKGILESVGIGAWFQAGGVWRPGTEIASPVDYGAVFVLASQADEAKSAIEQALEAGRYEIPEGE